MVSSINGLKCSACGFDTEVGKRFCTNRTGVTVANPLPHFHRRGAEGAKEAQRKPKPEDAKKPSMVDAGGNVGGKRLPTACLRHFNLNAKAQRTQRNAKETRTKG